MVGPLFTRLLMGLAVVALLSPSPAWAATVVLEAYSEKRPANATEILAPALDEFRERGFLAGPDVVGAQLEERESRPGGSLDDKEVDVITQLVGDGFEAWLRGEFENATSMLGKALEKLRANPAAITRAQGLRKLVEQALVGYALAQARLGHQDVADSTMSEFFRSFPDAEFSRATYGPEALALYQRVKKTMDEQGHGTLFVDSDDPTAVFFINERYEATGKIAKKGLWPGTYRVFVQHGNEDGRLHVVKVEANRETVLNVDWSFDASLVSSPGWAGFLFDSAVEQKSLMGPHAVRAGRALEASTVVVIGIGQVSGQAVVVGSVWDARTGQPTRAASVFVEPGEQGERWLRALARFLAGDEAEEGVQVSPPSTLGSELTVEVDQPSDGSTGRRFGAWKWLAAGTALASIASGAYLISIDGVGTDCPPGPPGECPYHYTTMEGGVGLIAGGAVLGGFATWMFFNDRREPPATRIGIAPLGDGASLWVTGEF